MGTNKTKAFTLVELIVVITILAILGTIAFVSLSGYSRDSRNSVRVSDVSLINTSLELFSIPVGKYPSPSNATNISSGATIVGYMGTVGESVTTQLKKLSKLPLDPKSNQAYEYSITASKREFQVMYQLEDGLASVASQANAASTVPGLKGNYNELYTISEDGSEYFAIPSLFPVNPDLTQADGFVMNNESAAVAFTPKSLGAKPTTSTGYINFTKALQNAYTGSLFNSKPAYTTLKAINLTDTGALETFTKASFGLLKADATVITSTTPTTPTVVVPTDPYWNNVVLLMKFDNSLTDETGKHTPTATTPLYSSTEKQFGSDAVSLGSGNYITVPSNSDFLLDGEFTIEWFAKANSTDFSHSGIFGFSGNNNVIQWYTGGGGLYLGDVLGTHLYASYNDTTSAQNNWIHYAITRDASNDVRWYVNGLKTSPSLNSSIAWGSSTGNLYIGYFNYSGAYEWKGYMDEVRITKGVARYTGATLDIPTETFPIQ